jgi:DNA-binding MarR family transcriptional regulator
MVPAERLAPAEEALWRATMRIVTALPSRLDTDLLRGAGLTASAYTTLLQLSEAPNHELRMTDLARATGLSASRTSRLVDDLRGRGLVTKVASSADARTMRARMTTNGMAKLRFARPVHLESVRRRLINNLDASSVGPLADALSAVARQLERGSRWRTHLVSARRTLPLWLQNAR